MLTTLQRRMVILILITILLSVPFIAMQFSKEVNWSGFDFLVASILLILFGLAIELILKNIKNLDKRIIFLGILIIAFFLLWAELAVGVFGSPIAGS